MMIHRFLIVCCALCSASGCIMHMNGKLRHNSVTQASSVRDMQQQQVLDNLAMFMCCYDAMPFFSYPNQSRPQVTDQANLGGTASGGRPNSSPFPFFFTSSGAFRHCSSGRNRKRIPSRRSTIRGSSN